MKIITTITNGIRYLFALLFLYTAISKLLTIKQFENQLKETQFFGGSEGFLTWLVPGFEIFTVLLLLIPNWRLKGLYASFILMSSFTIYIFWLSHVSYFLPCSCGGILEKLPLGIHMIINIMLLLITLIGIFLENRIEKSKFNKMIANNSLR